MNPDSYKVLPKSDLLHTFSQEMISLDSKKQTRASSSCHNEPDTKLLLPQWDGFGMKPFRFAPICACLSLGAPRFAKRSKTKANVSLEKKKSNKKSEEKKKSSKKRSGKKKKSGKKIFGAPKRPQGVFFIFM